MTPHRRIDEASPVRIALLGCGTVGSAVARLLTEQAEDLRVRAGRRLELVGIAVRDTTRERPGIDSSLLTDDPLALVTAEEVDLVVELIGGIEPARELVLAALDRGASVVTANKALLATHGAQIFETAERNGRDVYFEAAVAGAIPIIRPLRESLVGDEITSIIGIVNGTTNYILDKMHSDKQTFESALTEAQELGYAEADPTADVAGHDAAAKAAILAGLAFHCRVRAEEVFCEGITEVTPEDIAAAESMDSVMKLLAICQVNPEDETVAVRVHPTMVPRKHPLASVDGAYNAIFIESQSAGRLMFYGPGAGGSPTASAVMGDLVTVARNLVRGATGPGESSYRGLAVADAGAIRTAYHIRLQVADVAGTLESVAACFARNHVSVRAVRQEAQGAVGEAVELVIVTHVARTQDLDAAVAELRLLDQVTGPVRPMRVEG
ncbi:homoserine dehydrogenase [Parenemella sanctibonifatiensis]|uniref:Homoserine dehydrogenase n=1 Tax=Parenemella sanctibonifatiensis TaxID=2016505 RepID=A0A255E525_9ACTN|nr:homoserine dehydrogenase [Parenemella sanctibonifatiensis]OYN86616.1 homoserine dehydrogenase [Parenemella sanctibonifatiensis]